MRDLPKSVRILLGIFLVLFVFDCVIAVIGLARGVTSPGRAILLCLLPVVCLLLLLLQVRLRRGTTGSGRDDGDDGA